MNSNKPTVILLSGHSGSGKDFIANIMKTQLEKKDNKVLITHYADLLKYILKTFFNWDGKKNKYGRHLLQYVGTDVVRNQNPDYWVNFVNDMLTFFIKEWDYILIPDARFSNEIEIIKNNSSFNVLTIRVNRNNYKSILTDEQKNHPSETSLDNYKFDYYIDNDGTIDDANLIISDLLEIITYKKCFIDLDCCTINTVKCITELYDEDFKYYSDYKKIPWEEVTSWNFTELSAAPPKYIDYYFNQERFFDKVEMFKDAKDVIDKLSQKYNIIFVSHGYSPNLRLKEKWVNKNFPYANFIGVNLKEHNDKSCVNMSDGIFIDDRLDNLKSSNSKVKICFGDYEWNKPDTSFTDFIKVFDWNSVGEILL